MARQPYFSGQQEKTIEVFGSFGGGMNTQEHPSKLRDDTFQLLENVDLIAGGVIQNRGGYKRTSNSVATITGVSQGIFRYDDLTANGIILEAISGVLYKVVGDTYTPITTDGLAFQPTRPIEAVQIRDKMYFATGNGLLIYSGGTTATYAVAYKPTSLEALHIGTNGYATNPDTYLTNIDAGVSNRILGIMTDQRYGVVNKPVALTAYYERIASDTLEFQFSSKLLTDPKYVVYQAWSTAKVHNHTFTKNADYMIKCEVRKQGTTVVLGEYVISKFRVSSVADKNPEPTINWDDMKLCNRILFHYDRLVLYGDTNNPDHMYTSHLNNFTYFPRTNILRITDPLRGGLRCVTQYKNFLVAFTDNSISMITGMSPTEYVKTPVHTTLGTKHPYSVKVIKNHIVFVSQDNNVYVLKSFNFSTTDKLNVERIDLDIADSLKAILNATTGTVLSTIHNDQYYLYIKNGASCYIYRFYYEYGVWVRDTVANNFSAMSSIRGTLYLTNDVNGRVFQLTKGFYYDEATTLFYMNISTKDYDFNMPHHKKKLKQVQLIAKIGSVSITINVAVYLDNTLVVTQPVGGAIGKTILDSQKMNVVTSGRFRYIQLNFNIPVKADLQLLSYGFVFKQGSPK